MTTPTVTPQEQRVLANALQLLGSGEALAQHLEDYVVAYAVLGRLAAVAQGEAEMAEQDRKIAWAQAFSGAKQREGKVTNQEAEMLADLEVDQMRRLEIQKREKAAKLKATRESIEQAINAIKFLARNGG
jgi:hypothetical protein